MSEWRTEQPVRALSAEELGMGAQVTIERHGSNRQDDPGLDPDDPLVAEVYALMSRYGGVIFTGPPGTGKSWAAAEVALALVNGAKERRKFVQFHPSYQYEDFMEGYVPKKSGDGFELKPKTFVQMCEDARDEDNPDDLHVLVIDELSRGDAGRVFGEALTYVERSKRGLKITLASGRTCVIPHNVFIIATMNPLDRGVDEVDAAFERRFAKISMEPNEAVLRTKLTDNGVEPDLIEKIQTFFLALNGKARDTPMAAVGHTYFLDVVREQDVRDVWNYQLRFLIEKAYRLNPDAGEDVRKLYRRLFESAEDTTTAAAEPPPRVESSFGNGPTLNIEGTRRMAEETQAGLEASTTTNPTPPAPTILH